MRSRTSSGPCVVLPLKRVRQKASKRLKEASEAHSAAFRCDIDTARPQSAWHTGAEGLPKASFAPGSAASRRCRSSARSASPRRRRSEGPRDPGPRADRVVLQIHCELLELRELHQGRGQALSAFMAWEALDAAQVGARSCEADPPGCCAPWKSFLEWMMILLGIGSHKRKRDAEKVFAEHPSY